MNFSDVKVGMLLASKNSDVVSLVYKKTDSIIFVLDVLPERSYLPYDRIDRSDWAHSLSGWPERYISKEEKDMRKAIPAVFNFIPGT